ncbi:MAG: hypothetical protein E6541_08635 [Veillonella sp.]|nr:hypothetical protein [Veillonella sp.]
MTKQEAMERFSSGAVQQSLEIHRGIQWTGRIIGLVACALIVKYMPSDWAERVWYYLLLLVILWTLHRLGESQNTFTVYSMGMNISSLLIMSILLDSLRNGVSCKQ